MSARHEWVRKGQNAGEQDAQELLTRTYQALGHPPPPIYCFGSPLAAMLAIPHLAAHHKHHTHGLHSHVHFLMKETAAPLTSQVGVTNGDAPRRERLGFELIEALSPAEHGLVDHLINAKFLDSFTDRVCGILRGVGGEDLVQDRLQHGLFKNLDQGAFDWWRTVASTGCWWWPYSRFAVVAMPPVTLAQDEGGRLHRGDGPAVEFADGLTVWAWHGVVVSERLVLHPEELTEDDVQSEASMEIQRVMIERMGAGEYLRKSGAKLIDMDTLTLEGSAPRALMQDKLGNRWLVGTDGSTARVYTMSVPREARSCREAHQMIAGFSESRLIAEA